MQRDAELKIPLTPPQSPFFEGRLKPLFGKACPELSRREGKGRFVVDGGNY
jgi:hypothetical protein